MAQDWMSKLRISGIAAVVHFLVRVFKPHTPSNCKTTSAACYRRHELEKDVWKEDPWGWAWLLRVYCTLFQRWLGSFCNGGIQKRLASLLFVKLDQPYSRTLTFLRCKVTFSLLDSIIMCLRGTRSSFHRPAHDTGVQDLPLDLIMNEARLVD